MSSKTDDTHEESERLPTTLVGLDAILNGGVFRGGIYIVQGVPGSGKTIFANQICYGHAAKGRRALYVTLLAETHARMLAHMRGLSFFDESAVPDKVSYIGAFRVLEDEGLDGLMKHLRHEIRATGAEIVVLDGLATVGEAATSNLELKKFVHEMQTQAVFSGCTMFLLTSGIKYPLAFSPEYTMVDGLIELKTRMLGRRADRELQVHKLRGSDYLGGEHSFAITGDGIKIFPRIEALLAEPTIPDRTDRDQVSSGVAGFDDLLGGGPQRHSVTVVLGPAGSGKTTFGLQFLHKCTAEEPGLLFGLYEAPSALAAKAEVFGLAVAPGSHVDVMWQPATEAIIDEVCIRLLDAVRARKVRRLFLDGVDGLAALCPDKVRLDNVLSAVCNELRGLGVTTLMSVETDLAGIVPGQPLAGLALKGLSPIAENIVVLRLAAVRTQVHRLVSVLKARDARIDMRLRRYDITDRGLEIEADYASAEIVLRELMQGDGQLLAAPIINPDLGRG